MRPDIVVRIAHHGTDVQENALHKLGLAMALDKAWERFHNSHITLRGTTEEALFDDDVRKSLPAIRVVRLTKEGTHVQFQPEVLLT